MPATQTTMLTHPSSLPLLLTPLSQPRLPKTVESLVTLLHLTPTSYPSANLARLKIDPGSDQSHRCGCRQPGLQGVSSLTWIIATVSQLVSLLLPLPLQPTLSRGVKIQYYLLQKVPLASCLTLKEMAPKSQQDLVSCDSSDLFPISFSSILLIAGSGCSPSPSAMIRPPGLCTCWSLGLEYQPPFCFPGSCSPSL